MEVKETNIEVKPLDQKLSGSKNDYNQISQFFGFKTLSRNDFRSYATNGGF